ncbi:MAG: YraN family protein [Anaerolineae bacterium]|nr:YraN family protein [Anaerolineae bacterium]
MRELVETVRRLGIAVGELQTAFGATLEEEAGSVAAAVMRMKGYRVLQDPFSLSFDGEIDIVLPVEDSTGQRVWVVLEVKARLNQRDVVRWAQRMRSASWHRALAEKGCPGPYLAYVYGIRIDLTARQAAEAEGIGLMKGDGEVFPPRTLIEATGV